MKNKISRQTKNQKIDKLLEEQYNAETKILESALLKAAGKSSWEEFPEESEEEIQKGYDRLIAHLKEKGEYRETLTENSNCNTDRVLKEEAEKETEEAERIKEAEDRLHSFEYEWNKTHRILKPVAAIIAVSMLTALIGMSVTTGLGLSDVNAQTRYTAISEKK